MRIRKFSKSQRLYEGGARNFFKSQGPYRYGRAKYNILTYFFIFFTYFSYFPHYSYIFSIYSFIFLTYSFIYSTYSSIFPLLHQGIPECDVIYGGGGVYSQILKLPSGPDLEIFQNSLDIFSNLTSSVGVEGGVLANPDIT